MTHNTSYTIEKCGKNIMVWNNSKMVAQGFNDDESALNAIWTIEGKNQNDFYVVNNGVVARVERDAL